MIEAEDEPRVASIEAAADQLLVEQFGPELFTDVTPGKDRVADPGFVLVAGRPCVGFAHVLEERGTAHLQQLAVDPAHGRRGLGTALLNACCEEARLRGYSQLSLTTFRDVPYNAPWYARLGFVIIDEPHGVVARHVQQEQPYGRLAPRVAMSQPLGTPAASRAADVTDCFGHAATVTPQQYGVCESVLLGHACVVGRSATGTKLERQSALSRRCEITSGREVAMTDEQAHGGSDAARRAAYAADDGYGSAAASR